MQVQELLIYPIKSCGGVRVQEALVTRYGLALPSDPRIYDRRWMIVKDGRHLSQRVLPSMALIQPSFVENGLLLRAPNMPDLLIPVSPLPKEIVHCHCWDEPILGLRYDDTISHWFRRLFQSNDQIDLVIFDEKQFQTRSSKNKPDFPNAAEDHHVAVYHDDCWRDVHIGEAKLRWISPSLRCLLPTVDQETGIKDPNQEPWKTLRNYRLKPDAYGIKALLGIYLGQINDSKIASGTIHIGDSIHVIKQELGFWQKNEISENEIRKKLLKNYQGVKHVQRWYYRDEFKSPKKFVEVDFTSPKYAARFLDDGFIGLGNLRYCQSEIVTEELQVTDKILVHDVLTNINADDLREELLNIYPDVKHVKRWQSRDESKAPTKRVQIDFDLSENAKTILQNGFIDIGQFRCPATALKPSGRLQRKLKNSSRSDYKPQIFNERAIQQMFEEQKTTIERVYALF
ncbi:unnamed protein product [Rotaria magnacalcarata]|uniref:MOSC domain-containing protein n=2 Tax=Rotaria magnacalcarata TaxID=392030 RepID=A0A819V7V0_9BILA|nr:unnamed protein product [Rotaria magnacalcarata]CAF4104852.1 unnamed protein product [Rotaria magnacalcarata]